MLAGSLRDDGPLPDTITDMNQAQDAYAAQLKNAGLVSSTSDGNRMIDQGAVRIGDSAGTLAKVAGRDHSLPSGKFLIQVGKHKYRWVALQQG